LIFFFDLYFPFQGVKPDWTWEQTMRAIIAKPMYRALKTLAERKQAFQDYVDDLRKKEDVSSRVKHCERLSIFVLRIFTLQDEKKAKAIKIRQDFISLLETHPEVNSSIRYRY
jgi:hypothetical protein